MSSRAVGQREERFCWRFTKKDTLSRNICSFFGRTERNHVRQLVERYRGDPRTHGRVRYGLVGFCQQSVGRAAGGCQEAPGRSASSSTLKHFTSTLNTTHCHRKHGIILFHVPLKTLYFSIKVSALTLRFYCSNNPKESRQAFILESLTQPRVVVLVLLNIS